MKFKNKGRKIYKTKEKNYYGKSPVGKFFSGALTVLLIGGLGFLGYSVAEPIINYTKKKGDSEIVATNNENTSQVTDFSEPTAETIVIPENLNIEQYKAVSLKASDLSDISSLRAALQNISSVDAEYVSVPLKISGGEIYYASDVSDAQLCGAVKSNLTLSELTEEVRNAGYSPVAEISLFNDNLFPQLYSDAGYKTADDGSRWIDNSVENGGKPWLSPFSDSALLYLGAIADEIVAADFDKAVCSDVVFPLFRESDLALLGEDVNSSDRYIALTSAANLMYNKFINGGTAMMLEVSAVDLLKDKAEVLQPMMLDVNTLVLDINFDELGDAVATEGTVYDFTGTVPENAAKIIGLVKDNLSDFNVAVRFSGENTEMSELLKAKDEIAGYGYTSYVIG